MNVPAHIAQHLLAVHFGGNWTEVDLAAVLGDVTVAEATQRTDASPNTIAALVHHLTCWNRIMISRIHGVEPPAPPHNGYDVPPLPTGADWQRIQDDLGASARELAGAMDAFDAVKLEAPLVPGGSGAFRNMMGQVEHVHYHLGQIMLLKKLLRAQ